MAPPRIFYSSKLSLAIIYFSRMALRFTAFPLKSQTTLSRAAVNIFKFSNRTAYSHLRRLATSLWRIRPFAPSLWPLRKPATSAAFTVMHNKAALVENRGKCIGPPRMVRSIFS